jgi:hypothetical protein
MTWKRLAAIEWDAGVSTFFRQDLGLTDSTQPKQTPQAPTSGVAARRLCI